MPPSGNFIENPYLQLAVELDDGFVVMVTSATTGAGFSEEMEDQRLLSIWR